MVCFCKKAFGSIRGCCSVICGPCGPIRNSFAKRFLFLFWGGGIGSPRRWSWNQRAGLGESCAPAEARHSARGSSALSPDCKDTCWQRHILCLGLYRTVLGASTTVQRDFNHERHQQQQSTTESIGGPRSHVVATLRCHTSLTLSPTEPALYPERAPNILLPTWTRRINHLFFPGSLTLDPPLFPSPPFLHPRVCLGRKGRGPTLCRSRPQRHEKKKTIKPQRPDILPLYLRPLSSRRGLHREILVT